MTNTQLDFIISSKHNKHYWMSNILKEHKLSKSQLIQAFEDMLLVRRFEEKCGQLYGMGKIAGFCHLYIGQEAVIIGNKYAMKEGDSTVTSYRDHGHIIASGIDPKEVLAELMGRATGCSKGKGGSMHMFNIPGKFYGGHGIVGAQVPIGTGIALADQYNNTGNVSFTFLGDGAVHQGQVYESFNMASLWKLPVVYVIENNEYAMGTSVERSTVVTDLHKKGISFGIPGFAADGMDIHSMYSAMKSAADYARESNGPVIIEAKTYRYRGHSMSDPAKYRTRDEVDEFRQNRDPIDSLKKELLDKGYAAEKSLKEIEQKIKATIQDVVEFSENSPEPDPSELYTDIYND